MQEVTILKKPDRISFDDVHELLYQAHEENRQNNLTVKTSLLPGDELKELIGEEGCCFVGLAGEKLVATTSVQVKECKRWYAHGKVLRKILVAVLPEYRGNRLSDKFEPAVEAFAKENGYDCVEMHTARNNRNMQKAAGRQGYRYADFILVRGEDHYTVVMVKWLNGAPCSELQRQMHYLKNKLCVLAKYGRAPGKRKN